SHPKRVNEPRRIRSRRKILRLLGREKTVTRKRPLPPKTRKPIREARRATGRKRLPKADAGATAKIPEIAMAKRALLRIRKSRALNPNRRLAATKPNVINHPAKGNRKSLLIINQKPAAPVKYPNWNRRAHTR